MTQEHLSFVQKYLEEKYRTTVFDNFFDFKIVELKEGKAVYNVKIDKKHTNIYGFVHGGVFATICDVVMGVSCITLVQHSTNSFLYDSSKYSRGVSIFFPAITANPHPGRIDYG